MKEDLCTLTINFHFMIRAVVYVFKGLFIAYHAISNITPKLDMSFSYLFITLPLSYLIADGKSY